MTDRKEYYKQWKRDHKEHVKQYSVDYYELNRDNILAQHKKIPRR